MPATTRHHLLRFRFRRHDLHRPAGTRRSAHPSILDLGVQDTGRDGARWALAIRGGPPTVDDLALAWTLRGAPHAYRRADLDGVALATAPYSEDDAAKRIFDAAKPLKAAGLGILDALATVATEMRAIVDVPRSKGEVSTLLTARLPAPFLRQCRPCRATHAYEQPFRLAALQAGLELAWDTSPPVLSRIPGHRPLLFGRSAGEADPRLDPVRGHLRFYPGARVRDVAAYLDMPMKEVRARWPGDAVAVEVPDDPTAKPEPRFVLAEDLDDLAAVPDADRARVVRLVGSHDPYLQARDRELLVEDQDRRADLWRVLGRPGAVVADGEVVGTWRPRTKGGRLEVQTDLWVRLGADDRRLVADEAERLAHHRGLTLA